ncbi:tetratricopeptide repeat protein [Mucilaginibacter roseus]|uniref:Tetratricopeptide repeat protein n=1 Tax=Mucilaginibacter roseus TaxID=1528868 RepID=A0ABS8U8T7_9SPHI|nr:tetratricopeptide repeat protein [Mucilaginibacter roseus]MCD8742424.1 tetratricopeptide repeat protein [Mucilaginibacter roseus]
MFIIRLNSNAQDARTLVQEGSELAAKHDYTNAIEKYKAALKLAPDNSAANYQMAFSLNAMGKGADAIPYLQKVVAAGSSSTITASAYSLMGSIYDKRGQARQAIESYLQAIKLAPEDYTLHYNIALAYFRARLYAEAEKSALTVLAADPKHTASLRLYALVTFHQNKRAPALLALCRFLALDPNGASSAEAYGNLQSILKGGSLKLAPGEKALVVDALNKKLNQAITSAVGSIKKGGATAPLLAKQLSAVFKALGPLLEKQAEPFLNSLVTGYYQLAQADRMAEFADHISQSVDKAAAARAKASGRQEF